MPPFITAQNAGGTFPLTVRSDLRDHLQSRDAAYDFCRHRVLSFTRTWKMRKERSTVGLGQCRRPVGPNQIT
jgi:hypothetical protein